MPRRPATDRFGHMVVLAFASHRARRAAGVVGKFTAYYSLTRAAPGGYYAVPKSRVEEIKARVHGAGVRVLRRPYDDLGECWG